MPLRFLDLPGEIRNAIYEELLLLPGYLALSFTPPPLAPFGTVVKAHRENTYEGPHFGLAVVRASKQVYSEATQVLYSRNRFSITRSRLLTVFLKSIGPRHASLLHHIRIDLPIGASLRSEGQFVIREGTAVVLQDDGILSLDMLYRDCPNLATLEAVAVYNIRWAFELGLPIDMDEAMADQIIKGDKRVKIGDSVTRFVITKLRREMGIPPGGDPRLIVREL